MSLSKEQAREQFLQNTLNNPFVEMADTEFAINLQLASRAIGISALKNILDVGRSTLYRWMNEPESVGIVSQTGCLIIIMKHLLGQQYSIAE